jgi:hypothetical protein
MASVCKNTPQHAVLWLIWRSLTFQVNPRRKALEDFPLSRPASQASGLRDSEEATVPKELISQNSQRGERVIDDRFCQKRSNVKMEKSSSALPIPN